LNDLSISIDEPEARPVYKVVLKYSKVGLMVSNITIEQVAKALLLIVLNAFEINLTKSIIVIL
jgi:hypothetical protein